MDPRRDPAAYLRACAERYGDVFALTPGHVQVWDPAVAREVLRRDEDYPMAPARVPSQRSSIQEDAPERWRVARRYAWDALSPRVVASAGERMRRRWAVELGNDTRSFRDATEVVAATAAVVWPELLAPTATDRTLTDLLATTSHARQHLLRRRPLARRRLARQFDAVIGALLDTVRGRRLSGPGDPEDLLDALLAGREPALSDLEVAQTLAICLDSGMQTTGAAAAWVLHALAEHPDGAGVELGSDDGAAAFVAEVLRVTPVIAGLNRRAREDGSLGGRAVRAGTEVVVAVEGMHHDPRYWHADPSAFDPTRWSRGGASTPGAHLTYGAGPRTCLGMHVANGALAELVRVVAQGRRVRTRGHGVHRDNLNWPTGFPVEVWRR